VRLSRQPRRVSPDLFDLSPPEALRFHASRKHPSGGVWPTMVALVMNGAYGTSHVSWAAGKRRSFDYGAEQPFRLFVVAQRRNCCPDCPEQMRLSSAPCDVVEFLDLADAIGFCWREAIGRRLCRDSCAALDAPARRSTNWPRMKEDHAHSRCRAGKGRHAIKAVGMVLVLESARPRNIIAPANRRSGQLLPRPV
jgi:hypothetical protein